MDVHQAAAALRGGRLVVFPTETVYGVGAHALDPLAVAKVFAAKGRPADNPLIIHVGDAAAARGLAAAWPEAAKRLSAAFWPGPLTLVLPKAPHVPLITTGGLDSVAARVPAHPIAQALLQDAGVPVAAPSANRSGRPSPTRVEDARADLGDSVAVYLDGGPTELGLESTVVDVRGAPVVLRPGGVPRRDVEAALGAPVAVAAAGDAVRSPGMRYRHYAPRAPLHVVAPGDLRCRVEALRGEGLRVGVIASREHAPAEAPGLHVSVPGARHDAAAWAHRLFASLRRLDADGVQVILVEEPPEEGLGEALLDRLRKAAAH